MGFLAQLTRVVLWHLLSLEPNRGCKVTWLTNQSAVAWFVPVPFAHPAHFSVLQTCFDTSPFTLHLSCSSLVFPRLHACLSFSHRAAHLPLSHTQHTSSPRLSPVLPGTLPYTANPAYIVRLWVFPLSDVSGLSGFAYPLLVMAQAKACVPALLSRLGGHMLTTAWCLDQQLRSWDIYSCKRRDWCVAQGEFWRSLFGWNSQL